MFIRKYKSFMLILFFTLLISLQLVDAKVNSILPLAGKVITIDPGHGGRDSGAIAGKIYEKDLNLEISYQLKKILEENGATVYMTRMVDEDLSSRWDARKKRGDLYRRILFIQNKKSDIYLSIHLNAGGGTGHGQEVLYHPINKKNLLLAESIHNEFKEEFKTRRIIKKTNLYLYSNTRIPGVLIECGFLSNANDRYLLQRESYQKRLALAITKGVFEYFQKEETTS